MHQIKVILQPTDFSEPAGQAHIAACELAREHKAKLVVLHVTTKSAAGYIENSSKLRPDEFQQKLWETLRWPREHEAGLDVRHQVAEGPAVHHIVRVAREIHADLIVMGTHDQDRMLSWFTNNVVDHVVRDSPCSVLIVKNSHVETIPESYLDRQKNDVPSLVPSGSAACE